MQELTPEEQQQKEFEKDMHAQLAVRIMYVYTDMNTRCNTMLGNLNCLEAASMGNQSQECRQGHPRSWLAFAGGIWYGIERCCV